MRRRLTIFLAFVLAVLVGCLWPIGAFFTLWAFGAENDTLAQYGSDVLTYYSIVVPVLIAGYIGNKKLNGDTHYNDEDEDAPSPLI